ncbi:hypothetical protein I6B53_03270 [Schaalia sp. 19OD2882]|uniref:hypothetical protein n=1 Tax=Schaalia sp. 19OD2882 TaxID=2794089 RepID=UPI001C1EDE7B|nr:hypothetical protein [Schaalia sp. 19OD2882]QWW20131.1 hypothetical protein I6B53_03270 [Schaalia sp. 19OD2882]
MKKVWIQLDDAAVKAMLTSPRAQIAVNTLATEIARRAGSGFGVLPSTTSRARAYVRALTPAAKRAAANHALERAASGGPL